MKDEQFGALLAVLGLMGSHLADDLLSASVFGLIILCGLFYVIMGVLR